MGTFEEGKTGSKCIGPSISVELNDDGLGDGDTDTLTASRLSQQHDLRMAEIQLRREELEFERQEKKNIADIQRAQVESEARRQREKHEMMLQLMTFVTNGGAGGEGNRQKI